MLVLCRHPLTASTPDRSTPARSREWQILATCWYGRSEWPAPRSFTSSSRAPTSRAPSAFYAKLFDWRTEQNAVAQLHEARQLGRPQRRLGARRPGTGGRAGHLPAGRRSGRRRSTRWRRPAGACWCAASRSRAAARSGCSRIPTATCWACGTASPATAAAPAEARRQGTRGQARRRAQARRQAQKEEVALLATTGIFCGTLRGSRAPAMSSARRSRASLHAISLVLAALVFAAMALATKLAAARLPGPEIAFIRFLIGLVGCALAATRFRLRARNKLGLFMRGAYGGAAVLFYFIGDRPPAGRHRDAAQLHGAGVHGDLRRRFPGRGDHAGDPGRAGADQRRVWCW